MDAAQPIVWESATFSSIYSLYTRMVTVMSSNMEIVTHLITKLTAIEIDDFSGCFVHIFSKTGRIFQIIQTLLDHEFSQQKLTSRENSAASKISGVYSRSIGKEYLKTLLSDLVLEISTNENLDMEIQPIKLSENIYDNINENSVIQHQIEVNKEILYKTAQIFIDRITDEDYIKKMPKELIMLVKFTADLVEKYNVEKKLAVIGSIIIQRFIAPAMVTPEAYDLVPVDAAPSTKARRNLILLAKLVQSCSTGIAYGSKELYMMKMNPFIEQNAPVMAQFLARLIQTPLDDHEEYKTPSVKIEGSAFDMNYLLDFHLLLHQTKSRLIPELHELMGSGVDGEEMLSLLHELGAPPFLPAPGKRCPPWRTSQTKFSPLTDTDPIASSSISSSSSSLTGGAVGESSKGSAQSTDDAIAAATAALEKAGFLYLGPNTLSGLPVLYIIVNRFKKEYMNNVDLLITYVFQVLSLIGTSRYVLVVDMSWARMTEDMKRQVYKQVSQLSSIIERRIRKNLDKVFIVHPSAYTRAVLVFMRRFTSGKLKAKIVEIYNWESLQAYIQKNDILLPDSSKDFITKTYSVVKVNAKGKNQKRLIKFTSDSLLNIDPRTKRIQNEKKLADFAQFSIQPDTACCELQIRFFDRKKNARNSGQNSHNSKMFSAFLNSTGDELQRRYVFDSPEERDQVVLDIFRTCFFLGLHNYPQEYRVVKVNKRGRHQYRTFKLTCDSLLNLDGPTIKSEISFAGIDTVHLDNEKNTVMWILFKAEKKERKIICDDASQLMGALKEGMERYQYEDELEFEKEIHGDEGD